MPDAFMNRPVPQPTAAPPAAGLADAALPVGAFVVPGDRTVLIDAGVGPRQPPTLVGGALLGELARLGFRPTDIDMVAVTHRHLDHIGWLGTDDGDPVFENATVCIGRADFEYIVSVDESAVPEPFRVPPGVRAALARSADTGRLLLVDDPVEVASGVVAIPAPGHTLGHVVVAVGDRDERLMLLGDSMYCPEQLTDADLTAVHDVDPVLARRTRETILREMDRHGTSALGCHFPGLRANRVLGGSPVAT